MFILFLLFVVVVNIFLASFLVGVIYFLATLAGGLGGLELLLMLHLTVNVLFSIFLILGALMFVKIFRDKIHEKFPNKKHILKIIFLAFLVVGFPIHFLQEAGILHGSKVGDEFYEKQNSGELKADKTVVFDGSTGWEFPIKDDKVLFTVHTTVDMMNVWDLYFLSLDKNSQKYDLQKVTDLIKNDSVKTKGFGQDNSIFYIVENQNTNGDSLYSYDLETNTNKKIKETKDWTENKLILDKYKSLILKDDCNYTDYYFYESKGSDGDNILTCHKDLIATKRDNVWKLYNTLNNSLIYQSKEESKFTSYNTVIITDNYFYYNIDGNKIVRVDLKTKEEKIVVEDSDILDFAITDNFVVYKNGVGDPLDYQDQIIVVKMP